MITVILISLTVVSATDNDSIEKTESDIASENDTSVHTYESITKKTTDNVTKTSTNNEKTASKTTVSPVTIRYNTTTKLSANITTTTGKKISEGLTVFKINGKTVGYSNVTNGTASYVYNASVLTPKSYNITVKYGGTSKYLESSSNYTLTIAKSSSKIVVKNVEVTSNETVKITAIITDSNTGAYATGGKVAFKLNGKTIGHVYVNNGKAELTYKAVHSAKSYKLNATYGGDKFLNSSRSSTASFIVNARPTKITLNKISGYSTTVVLKASVIDKLNSKNLTSGTVVFKINDKTVGNASISKGIASLTYNSSQLVRGQYKLSAHLKPSSFYATTSATNNLTILAESSFTYDQIKSAAIYVRTKYESNKTLISVPISKSHIGLSDFLALMIRSCENCYKGKSANVSYKKYSTLTTQTDSFKKIVLNISQVREIGNRTLNFMENNGRPPKYVSTEYGQIGYFNIVYTYCRVMDVSAYNYLPSTCRVYSWSSMHPSNPKSRMIYITSDHILNNEKDYFFMECIKERLKTKGFTAEILGYGPNAHNTAIRNQSLPISALQVSIFGGADSGVIYDICTRSFMKLKESRMIYMVYYPDHCTDITGLAYLKRAYDDNYSPSSFKGIANPDIYLKDHGYDYIYSKNVNTIVDNIIKYIS